MVSLLVPSHNNLPKQVLMKPRALDIALRFFYKSVVQNRVGLSPSKPFGDFSQDLRYETEFFLYNYTKTFLASVS